jgi:pimeloyl-ACP methyl ester carboxylesterase
MNDLYKVLNRPLIGEAIFDSEEVNIDLQKLVLVGHSFGGIGSIEACQSGDFAKKVRACVALDPGILPKG